MNILIAGIVTVIILLLGGTGYYNYRHHNQPELHYEPRTELHYEPRTEFDPEHEQALHTASSLPVENRNGRHFRVVRTEDDLISIIVHVPQMLTGCALYLSSTLTQERVLELFQEHKTAPDLISGVQFIPEGSHV
jgi:hypothetical protein